MQGGRKLAEWSIEEQQEGGADAVGAADGCEEAELQQAIQLSLAEATDGETQSSEAHVTHAWNCVSRACGGG